MRAALQSIPALKRLIAGVPIVSRQNRFSPYLWKGGGGIGYAPQRVMPRFGNPYHISRKLVAKLGARQASQILKNAGLMLGRRRNRWANIIPIGLLVI